MPNLYIVTENGQATRELCQGLPEKGYPCTTAADFVELPREVDAVLLEARRYTRLDQLARAIKREKDLPVIALLHDMIDSPEDHLDLIDDFLLAPWNLDELELRLKRRLRQRAAGEGVINCGDLIIDTTRYEVFVAGRPVVLTFKEYELLKFLATNADHVFTREALLNKVWGYDYYGGDRTVDVHITRLRTKIDDSKQVSIETVRNIGYRLKISP